LNSIAKLFERKGLCDDITNDNLSEKIYQNALALGVEGYRNYTQAAKMLGISKNYLYVLISQHKDEIGEPYHNPILEKANWLTVNQIKKLETILKKP